MATKIDALLDQIGGLREDIGGFRADIRSLREDRDRLERTLERYHEDNQSSIGAVRDGTQAAIGELREGMNRRFAEAAARDADLEQQLAQHAEKVSTMQPQIKALQFSRSRVATLASIGLVALTGIAWIVEQIGRWAIERVLSMKFGGG